MIPDDRQAMFVARQKSSQRRRWHLLISGRSHQGDKRDKTTRSDGKMGKKIEEPSVEPTAELTKSFSAALLADGRYRRRSTNIAFSSLKSAQQEFTEREGEINHQTPSKEPCYKIVENKLQELGYLRFDYKDLHDALAEAAISCKPVLCFEAEVPGDLDAGRDIFSHPLIVEAVESLFVTVQQIHQPHTSARSSSGWTCCTRVRLLDEYGKELLPIISGAQLTRFHVISALMTALQESCNPTPKYLKLIQQEERGHVEYLNGSRCFDRLCIERERRDRRALFGIYNAPLAETELAGLAGVLGTKLGKLDGQRVVFVEYDSEVLSYPVLVRFLLNKKLVNLVYFNRNEERMCATMEIRRVHRESYVVLRQFDCQADEHQLIYDCDPKHALRKTPMRFVPLTALQVSQANRLIHLGKFNEAVQLLSPRQGLILRKAMQEASRKKFYEVVDVPILPAWLSICGGEHPRYYQKPNDPVEDASDDEDYEIVNRPVHYCTD